MPAHAPLAAAREFTARLADVLGDRLRSVVLYGSAARDEFVDAWSDINLLLFIDHVDAQLLQRAGPLVRKREPQHIAPLILRWDDRERAADAFAIELLDMRDAHTLLHGVEAFEGIHIEHAALRLQAERELRSRLAMLHSRLLWVTDDGAAIGRLLTVALPSFVTYLRAALRLAGRPVPLRMREVIDHGTALVDAPAAGFLAALEARQPQTTWQPALDDDVVTQFRIAAERTADFVDSIEKDTR